MLASLLQFGLHLRELPVALLGLPQLHFQMFHNLLAELAQGGAFTPLLEVVPLSAQVGLDPSDEQEGINGL